MADCDEFDFPDLTPPEIGVQVTGTEGDDDWFTSDVTVTWTVADAETPDSVTTSGCSTTTQVTDTTGTPLTCTSTSDGGTAATDA